MNIKKVQHKPAPMTKPEVKSVNAVAAPHAKPSYPGGEPELPKNFTCLSAQHNAEHDDKGHEALRSQLKIQGFHPMDIEGHYGHPEKSFMVPHDGSEQSKKALEDIAFNGHRQESVIHHNEGRNELKMRDGSKSWAGQGHTHGEEISDFYSVLPSGHKFRLNVTPPSSDMKKSQAKELVKPHCYGQHDGVWVFHAKHPSHDSLVGDKYSDLDDAGFKEAIKHAKKRNIASIVLSGTPPSKLLTRIHPELGPMEAGHVSKSDLAKAFLQPDGGTVTDTGTMSQAMSSLPESLKQWGANTLSRLPADAVEGINLDGKTIKVRKHGPDQYSGWIEHQGNKIHGFEKLTLPELLVQLRSKLDLYGKEDTVVADQPKTPDLGNRIKELRDRVRSDLSSGKLKGQVKIPAKEFVQEHDRMLENLNGADEPSVNAEADKQAQELEQKLKAMEAKKELPKIISGKDLLDGLANPQEECEACERPVDKCCCYSGLPVPRLEFDGKKVSIFFKSEWGMEDRENFTEDLKRRAGRILKSRYNK